MKDFSASSRILVDIKRAQSQHQKSVNALRKSVEEMRQGINELRKSVILSPMMKRKQDEQCVRDHAFRLSMVAAGMAVGVTTMLEVL